MCDTWVRTAFRSDRIRAGGQGLDPARAGATLAPMDERDDTPRPAPAPASKDAKSEREARLAKALRENLRRRKAQARAREAPKPGDDETR